MMTARTCTCSPDRVCTCDWPDVIDGHEIDKRFMADWVEFGIAELAHYLRNHGLFTEYLARQGLI